MTKIVFLSCNKITGFYANDDTIRKYLETKGYEVDIKNWDADVDWYKYDAMIFRSTWDYFEREDEFRVFLDKIDDKKLLIFNDLKVIKNNIHKFYLKQFEEAGVKIIPSIFLDKNSNLTFEDVIPNDWLDMVIKPAFSGGGYLTERFKRDEIERISLEFKDHLIEKDFIIQKFIPEVQTTGEISLLFFNKKYSHAIIKHPKDGDFRVQSHFGGIYSKYEPSQRLVDEAISIVNAEPNDLLYARVDGILINDEFYLMEVELIEPDLFIQFDDMAAERFEQALTLLMNKANDIKI